MERELAVIFRADVKNSSRIMGEDEAAAFRSEMVAVWQHCGESAPSSRLW